ncbi:MAG: hypothetical protein HC927_06185 [Deltaproteobacteria bacterium]|nr:hypothetical protein [Deltaproteobacteria bacterium]
MLTRIIPCLVLLTTIQCGEPEPEPSQSDVLADACQDSCLKVLCSGVVDPEGDPNEMCRTSCAERVDAVLADGDACGDAYLRLHECLTAANCDEFQAWLVVEPDRVCTAQETVFASECPNVEVHDEMSAP